MANYRRGVRTPKPLKRLTQNFVRPTGDMSAMSIRKQKLKAIARLPQWVSQSRHISEIIKQNWNQFLLAVKVTALKQQISNFYPQIQRTDASDHICASHRPVINVKSSLCA